MKKRYLILICILLIGVFIKVQFFPFGYRAMKYPPDKGKRIEYDVKSKPNTTIYSYKLNVRLKNKDEFIDFLIKNSKNKKSTKNYDLNYYELGSFMDSNGDVNWQQVSDSVTTYLIGWEKVYMLRYKTLSPECNGYILQITNDGYVKDYRSSGK